MNITQLRDEIREIDLKILELIKNRLELAKKIGLYKKEHKYPIRDLKVEEAVIERAKVHSVHLGIPPELAIKVMNLLIEYSVKIQLQLGQMVSKNEEL
jgi:chorismate mutase